MADLHNLESSEKAALRRRAANDAAVETASVPAQPVHPLLRLQGQVGNAHIARMLAQRAAEQEEEVQAKHERVGLEGGAVGPMTTAQIQSMRGGGSPLDTGTRTSMEASFGTSFADVRVHANNDSDALNRRLTARAFTTGNDIFLRRDSSPSDVRLIAHELTHVVQQRSMSGGGGGMTVGAAGDGHERHADTVADAVTGSPSTAVQAKHQMAQRAAEEEEEAQASHDLAQRAAEEEEEAQASHDLAQRAAEEEEEVQASHDVAQRAAEEEEEVQASHDITQRASEEEEEVQASHDVAQRAAEEEEEVQASHDVAQREPAEAEAVA
jgi:Domain of unknown function (DUF4157)